MEYYIAGIDPGSTIGYSILNLNGEIIEINSFKGSLNETITRVTKQRKIVLIGTDVKSIPRFVKKISATTGAKIVYPEKNLQLKEKKKLTKEFLRKTEIKTKNKHETDALAAALIALKSYKNLFNKIDTKIKNEQQAKEIKKIVLTKNISIQKAINELNIISKNYKR